MKRKIIHETKLNTDVDQVAGGSDFGKFCECSALAYNVGLFAVAGIGGFKNGAQRNVKADLL